MWIKISPNDTLFFRSGRPFSMGFESWADGIFPPYPSTIYGALRTYLIFERGTLKDFKEGKYTDIGTPDGKGKMKIKGPIIFDMKNDTAYFPIPYDLVKKKENEESLFLLSLIDKQNIFFTDLEEKFEKFLIYKGKEQVDTVEGYLDNITFKEYLEGKRNLSYTYEKFYTPEPKIGIARDDITLTSKEAHLYRLQMIRLKKEYGFLVRIDGVDEDMPEKGAFVLGGEGKTVCFEKVSGNPVEELENIKFKLRDGIFKIYLATPAIFKNGWLPGWIDEKTMEGVKDKIKLKLIACATGKFIRIGGWDMAKNEPKPMYKAVPPGSVYYFKILNGTPPEEIKRIFHLENISDINPEEGFGLSLVGVVG